MLVTIKNEALQVVIDTLGAQLRSIVLQRREYLVRPKEGVWNRSAPLLFPVIGRLRGEEYLHHAQRYPMPRHGFARDLPFHVIAASDRAIFELASGKNTLCYYPFSFTLQVEYRLDGNALVKTFRVVNRSPESMAFALGGHDGFSIAPQNSTLVLNAEDFQPLRRDEAGFLGNEYESLPTPGGTLELTDALFAHDALVTDRIPRHVTLCSSDGRGIELSFPDFHFFALWSPKGGISKGLVCLEPWSSLPDGADTNEELSGKRAYRTLAASESCELQYSIRPFFTEV